MTPSPLQVTLPTGPMNFRPCRSLHVSTLVYPRYIGRGTLLLLWILPGVKSEGKEKSDFGVHFSVLSLGRVTECGH